MKKILDLYSGLGGFSEAFVNDSNYEVMRLEINPLLSGVSNTEIMDVKQFLAQLKQLKLSEHEVVLLLQSIILISFNKVRPGSGFRVVCTCTAPCCA